MTAGSENAVWGIVLTAACRPSSGIGMASFTSLHRMTFVRTGAYSSGKAGLQAAGQGIPQHVGTKPLTAACRPSSVGQEWHPSPPCTTL